MLNSVLGSFSSGVAPVTSSYESIATVTVGSGGSSSISFTSIPATYTHLQIRIIARSAATGTGGLETQMQFNSDSGTNYVAYHQVYGDGASVAAASSVSQTNIAPLYTLKNGNTASAFDAGIIDILDYANTNKYKTTRSLHGYDTNGAGYIILRSGLWMSTSAISSISFVTQDSSNYVQYTQFALYGIKGS